MITLTDRLKAIERFVLEHRPPPEIRTHLHLLSEHLEMEDSLLAKIARIEDEKAKLRRNFRR